MNAIAAAEMTVVELRKLASTLGIKNISRLAKSQLAVEVARASEAADAIKADLADATPAEAVKLPTKKVAKGSVKTAKQMAAEIMAETAKVTEAFAETPRKPLTKAQREASEAAIAAVKKAAGVVEEPAPAKAEKATKADARSAQMRDTAKAPKAKAAKAPKAEPVARKKSKSACSMPNCFRQQDKSVIGPELCDLHLEEADWENTHNDNAHDRIAAKDVAHKDFGSMTASEYREWIRDTKAEMEKCWTCHEELNLANAPVFNHGRAGTSRAGMVMTVPVRGSGEEKAAAVIAALAAVKLTASVRVLPKAGLVVLLLQGKTALQLTWSVAGKYDYAASNIDGHKVRNVSAALKAVGAA
jgi:hypothetical protein